MPDGGQMNGNGQMNGERNGSGGTAKTAATNLSILGAFAVLAYYLEKLLANLKKKKTPAAAKPVSGTENDAATETAAETDAGMAEESQTVTADTEAPETADTEAPETADTEAPETADAAAPETTDAVTDDAGSDETGKEEK